MNKTSSYRLGVNVSLLLMAAMLSVSCSSMKGAFKKIDLTKISIGMAKEEVIAALKKDPANTVAAKRLEDGVMELS